MTDTLPSWQPGHGLGRRPSLRHPNIKLFLELGLEFPNFVLEKKLVFRPQLREIYDQGHEGSCVGYGFSWAMSMLNKKTYDAYWLYRQAQLVDEWSDTPPEEGTSLHAAAKILIEKGHRKTGSTYPSMKEGLKTVRWSTPRSVVNDIRTAIQHDIPYVIGIDWYTNFDAPKWDVKRGWIIGEGPMGTIRGGHCVCIYGVNDTLRTVNIVNNWGLDYPLVKMPYDTIEKLANEGGEFAVITDR